MYIKIFYLIVITAQTREAQARQTFRNVTPFTFFPPSKTKKLVIDFEIVNILKTSAN